MARRPPLAGTPRGTREPPAPAYSASFISAGVARVRRASASPSSQSVQRPPSPSRGARQRSASRVSEASDDDADADPTKGSRSRASSVASYRADPALREALDSLDDVRRYVPMMEDFALENFFGSRAMAPATTTDVLRAGLQMPVWSTDLLLEAARATGSSPSHQGEGGRRPTSTVPNMPPVWLGQDASRSTSPGSTRPSSWGESSGSASAGSAQREGLGAVLPPWPPSAGAHDQTAPPTAPDEPRPPQSARRPRVDSAGRRRPPATAPAPGTMDGVVLHTAR